MIVKHFMLGPGWQEGWIGCSFEVDHVDGALVHLEHHDVSYVAVSRAPVAEIETYKKRMVWLLIGAYNCLDLTPKGRNETGPNYDLTDWVRRHDRYDAQVSGRRISQRLPVWGG